MRTVKQSERAIRMRKKTMNYQNLVLIGTSHIAKESLVRIRESFERVKPDILAVELDPSRLSALMSGKKKSMSLRDVSRVGFKGYLFALIGAWAERKLGEGVGMSPGEDMLCAVRMAGEHKIPVALIDQDISITLSEFSRHLTWKEKGRFVWDILKAVLGPRQSLPFDLRTIPAPEVVSRLTRQVRRRYPSIYKVLVTDRNVFMANRLAVMMKRDPKKVILAVIGAGHEEEVRALVKRSFSLPQPGGAGKH